MIGTPRTLRQARSELVGWCAISRTWQPLSDVWCGWDHGGRSHKLRKRRALICSVCRQAAFSRREFREHICFSAY